MSMKQEIETWVSALQQYDNNEFEAAITTFTPIQETSKILFNIGVIKATLGLHEEAVAHYQRAVSHDQYLAVAYFQQGVSNFLLGDFEEALANFNDTLLYLRGNKFIDYEQLGLKFKLYSCEALFNRGLCYIYLQHGISGMQDLRYAAKEKSVADHDVIDEAIKENAEGYTVFSIPVGLVFRPSEAKVKNVRAKNYLGNPQLVATTIPEAQTHPRHVSQETWARDDRPIGQLSYASLHLLKSNLASRPFQAARLQSEPPVYRDMFPPTPPPEDQKPFPPVSRSHTFDSQRSNSPNQAPAARPAAPRSHSATRRPPPSLDLTAAGSNLAHFEPAERSPPKEQYQRRAPARTQSERPSAPRRQLSDSTKVEDRGRNEQRGARNQANYRPSAERGLFGMVNSDFDPRNPETSRSPARQREEEEAPVRPTRSFSRNQTFPRTSREAHHDLISEDAEAEAEAEAAAVAENSGSDNGILSARTYSRKESRSRTRHSESKESTRSSSSENGFVINAHVRARSSSRTARLPPRSSSRTRATRVVPDAPPVRVKKIRIKAHLDDDMRHIMAPSIIDFGELMTAVSRKFELGPAHPKLKLRDDDGDLVTLADQEDLNLAVTGVREAAQKDGVEMGKLELWVVPVR